MFTGESSHTLDAKNRVFVPKRFQEVLERNEDGQLMVVLTRGFEKSLFLFSDAGFRAVLERLQTQPFGGAKQRTMQRLFFSNTHRTQLDGSGRLVLPEKLRSYAGIEREVVMLGVADRAEIWGREAWEKYEAENDAGFDELDDVLMGQGGAVSAGEA